MSRGQMHADLRKEFSDPPTDLHELQAQGVQLHPLYPPTLSVMSVEFIGLIGFVGHHKAGVGALFHHLGFVDDPALDLPASRLVMALGKQPDLSPALLFVATLGLL